MAFDGASIEPEGQMVSVSCRWPVILLVAAAALGDSTSVVLAGQARFPLPAGSHIRQQPEAPLPDGQSLTAADGDTVVIEGDARVRIIRRRPAFVRVVANVEQRFVIVLVENLRDAGDVPTRISQKTYEFSGLREPWPLAARWEGVVWLEEEYPAGSSAAAFGSVMLSLDTPDGKVAFANAAPDEARIRNDVTVVGFQGMGMGGSNLPFDEEEVRARAMAERNAAQRLHGGGSSVGMTFGREIVAGANGPIARSPAIRGGVNPGRPHKIHHVDPVWPAAARAAGITGVVVLELGIAGDGAVTDARVLRGVPELDQAARDAVRQWRYAPTLFNGQPVPTIVTVSVPFMR